MGWPSCGSDSAENWSLQSESTAFWSPSWTSVSRGSVLPVSSLHCSVLVSKSQFMEIKFCEMIAFSNVEEMLGRRGKKAGENWVFILQCVINIPRGIQVAIAHLKFGLTSVLLWTTIVIFWVDVYLPCCGLVATWTAENLRVYHTVRWLSNNTSGLNANDSTSKCYEMVMIAQLSWLKTSTPIFICFSFPPALSFFRKDW